MNQNEPQLISFPCLYKIIHLTEKVNIDDSGDYDREFITLESESESYTVIDNEKEYDDFCEYYAEPDIRIQHLLNLPYDLDEIRKISCVLSTYTNTKHKQIRGEN
jgi:hypothetical protein